MTTVDKGFGGHSVAGNMSYFESKEEAIAFYAALENSQVWNKEAYCNEISRAIDAIVSAKFIELDYTNFEGQASIGDVINGTLNSSLTWNEEAIAVKAWYDAVYEYQNAFFETATEETAITVEEFISLLPQL